MAMSRKSITYVSERDKTEPDIWGTASPISAGRASDLMYDRLPDLAEITIPRDVFERTDLSPTAKLIYGLFAHYREWKYWRYSEISGLIGESTKNIATHLKQLEDAGLLKCDRYEDESGSEKSRLPYKYYAPIIHSRLEHSHIPKFLQNDISNIETELKERFYGFKS